MSLRHLASYAKARIKKVFQRKNSAIDALYAVLYHQVHNLEQAKEIIPNCTEKAFSQQWSVHPTGEFLLSDPWFRENVSEILSRQEILLKKDWFLGKRVLDGGCGNGRWAYGFSQLGADLTCVDINKSALEATRETLQSFDNPQRFIHSSLEELGQHVKADSFDLVFSWGVLHHCPSFTRSLHQLANAVRPGGFLYLYLYGRESVPMEKDLELFRKSVAYNVLMDDKERSQFLLKEAKGDPNRVHNVHDIYAPLINRRLQYTQVSSMLQELGFVDIIRTIDHTELFIRASKGPSEHSGYLLQPRAGPYWFQSHG